MMTDNAFQYLCIDKYIQTLIDARTLKSAFELNLIDFLIEHKQASYESLHNNLTLIPQGLKFLLDLLRANQVIEIRDERVSLTQDFNIALTYRDLLESKLDFANIILPDLYANFTLFISRPQEFMRRSNVFDLFRYDRCFEATPENLEMTRRWVHLTTCLTRYEALACMKFYEFDPHKRALDIGGNSGEFVLRICRKYHALKATVFDLPLVCDIGADHVSSKPEAKRIQFVKGDVRKDPFPEGHDLIMFKSFLHDWPEQDALQLITKASQALSPGGAILIFERGPIDIGKETPPYSMITNMFFLHCFRAPTVYTKQLKELGFQSISHQRIDLEMPFYLVSARKAL